MLPISSPSNALMAIAQSVAQEGENSPVLEYSRSVLAGVYIGAADLVHTVTHPHEVIYAMSELVYDATIILVNQDLGFSENEIRERMPKGSPAYRDAMHRMQERVDHLKQYGEEFSQASGPKKVEMGMALATTILAPGWVFKGVQAASTYSRFKTLETPVKFHDVYNTKQFVKIINYKEMDIRQLKGNVKFNYVIDEGRNLIMTPEIIDPFMRHGKMVDKIQHSDLSQLKSVHAAGEFFVKDGQLVDEINNASGRFLPIGSHLKAFVEEVFVENGLLEAAGKYKDVSADFHNRLHRRETITTLDRIGPFPSPSGVAGGSFIAMHQRFNALNSTLKGSRVFSPFFIQDAEASEGTETSQSDLQEMEKIKALLAQKKPANQDELVKRAEEIGQSISQMEEPEETLKMLTPAEKKGLNKLAREYRDTFKPHFMKAISSGVDYLNGIVDPVAFVKVAQVHEEDREAFAAQSGPVLNKANTFEAQLFVQSRIQDALAYHAALKEMPQDEAFAAHGLPILHMAFDMFRFINPREAQITQSLIQNGGQMLKGLGGIADELIAKGIEAIGNEVFALSSGNVLSGLMGILSLFQRPSKKNEQSISLNLDLSNQISRMHEDLLEGLRVTSIALGIVDWHAVKGFLKTEATLAHNQQEVITHFEQMQRFLYVDRAYLQQIKAILEQNNGYQIMQQIKDADWRETREAVRQRCELYPKSMTAEHFIKSMEQIDATLRKVQQDGLSRTNEVQIADHAQVYLALSVANSRVSDKQRPSLADNFHLRTEQNLHLLVKYLSPIAKKMGLKAKFPPLDDLYNPAALHDLSVVAQQLTETYSKTSLYMGIPEEPTSRTLSLLTTGMDNYDALLKVLATLVPTLIDDYVAELNEFRDYFNQYLKHAALKYYGENIQPRLQSLLENTGSALMSLDKGKSSEFFKMDGHQWFGFIWNHWWNKEGRWSHMGWNNVDTGYPDRPSWRPDHRINGAKELYRQNHHQRAEEIHQKRIDDYQAKRREFEQSAHFDNESFKEAVINFILYGNTTLGEWRSFPYQFQNEGAGIPLPTSQGHLKLIPKVAFVAHGIGFGDLQFVWKQLKADAIELRADIQIKKRGFSKPVTLFQQPVPLTGSAQNLNLMESLHYTFFGGHLPTGKCKEFDLDLKRFVTNARQDFNDYNAGKVLYDCPPGRCHDGYRATVCLPETTEVAGLFPVDLSASSQEGKALQKIDQLPVTALSEAESGLLERQVMQKMQQSREEIMRNLAAILDSGSVRAAEGDPELPEPLKKNLLPSFNRLGLKGHALKMVFSQLINSNQLGVDPSWPNIFSRDDILRELYSSAGRRVYLSALLTQSGRQLMSLKPKIVKAIQGKLPEHYPFVHIKKAFQEYLQQISPQLVPNIIAASKPENLEQLQRLSLQLAHFPSLKDSLLRINPALNPLINPPVSESLPGIEERSLEEEDAVPQTNSATRAQPFYAPLARSINNLVRSTLFKAQEWLGGSSIHAWGSVGSSAPLNAHQIAPLNENQGERPIDRPPHPATSTFHLPLSRNDKLTAVQWFGQKFVYHRLPWNRSQVISDKAKELLESQFRQLDDLEKTIANMPGSSNQTISEGLSEARHVLKATKKKIKISLTRGKMSSSTESEIRNRIESIQKRFRYTSK